MAERTGDTTHTFAIERQPEDSAVPCLVLIRGAQLGRRIVLDKPELRLGRSSQCDIVVPLDGVSRQHCVFFVAERRVRIRDAGSKNGTWVQGDRVPNGASVVLTNGDVIHAEAREEPGRPHE